MRSFSTPWEHQKTIKFSDVFRGYRKGALGKKGLIWKAYYFHMHIFGMSKSFVISLSFLMNNIKILTLKTRIPHICGFLDCFSLSHFFSRFLSLLKLKTKFIKICTKLCIKQVKKIPSRCTSLLLSKPVQRNCVLFSKKFKKHCAL